MAGLYIARFDTRHFEFEGVGKSAAEAVDMLRQGLRQHGLECSLAPEWWWLDLYRSEAEAIKESLRHNVRKIEGGTAYRDQSELATPADPAPMPRQQCEHCEEFFSAEDVEETTATQWLCPCCGSWEVAPDLKPAAYEAHQMRLEYEGFKRGPRDKRTTFTHPDGRQAFLTVSPVYRDGGLLFTVKRA